GDSARLGRALLFLGAGRMIQGQYAEALDCAREAVASEAAREHVEIRLLAPYVFGATHFALGNYPMAIGAFQTILSGRDAEMATRRFGASAPPNIVATTWLTLALTVVGDFPQALALASRGLETSSAPLAQAQLYFSRSQAFERRGDFESSRSDAE